MVKEVGSGISAETFIKLVETGIQAVDVGGSGGTSWSIIEGLRGSPASLRLGELFRGWGLRTEQSLIECVSEKARLRVTTDLVATGGIRDGIQAAKAVAIGASLVGIGLPLFRAAASKNSSRAAVEAVVDELRFLENSLRIALFCSGARNLAGISSKLRPF